MNMRDPMSQMAQAQRLTIPQLQQALRNGTINPQVGQIVLASKIKQDKDAKMAMAAQAPKQPPVVAQNLAYGAGVDTLPSNLPVEGMAQGGIIALAEGGTFSTDDMFMPMTINQYNALLPEQKQKYVNQYGAPPEDNTPKRNPLTGSNTLLNRAIRQGTPLRPEVPVSAPGIEQFNIDKTYPKKESTKAPAPAPATAKDKPSMLDSMLSGSESRSSSTRTKGAGTGIGGYNIKPYTEAEKQLKAQYDSEMNQATGKEYTFDEIAARRKEQQKAAGIDFDVYGKQRTELEGKKNLSDTRSRLNEAMPYFALAERLGQAPRPGETTMTAFSSALANAGRTKAEIDDKEEARQERIGDKLTALAVAQNQFNAAQFSGNEADLKESRNRIKETRSALTNLGIKGVDQQNEMAKTMYEIDSRERIAANQVAATRYAADKGQNTVMNIAKIIKRDNPEISDSEAIRRAYETSNPGFGAIDQRDIASQRTALNKELSELSPFDRSPATIERRKQITAALNALSGGAGSAGAAGPKMVSFSELNPG